jgi:hypothetical protein
MNYPHNKQFAFTIIDDTEGDNIENTRPIYEFLAKLDFRTTKTVWALPPRDHFRGLSLGDYHYRQYIKKLQRDGFEIALHGVGSGRFTRQDILDGLEVFRQFMGFYPKIQINHSQNPDNLYWGIKRFSCLRPFWRWSKFGGDDPKSIYFWGDYARKYLKFIRNFTFKSLNTLQADPYMPYKERQKEYANFWFSAADGADLEKFNHLLSQKNIDRLIQENGAAIIYTHFAQGFVRGGRLDRTFQRNLVYLARRNGWFVPAGVILDYLLKQGRGKEISWWQKVGLEFKWLLDKIF